MRATLIFSWLIFCAGCASTATREKGGEPVEMASIVGTLLEAKTREQHIWPKGKGPHDVGWSSEIDLAIDTPAEFAGLRIRFSMPVHGPVSYENLKGRKVRMTLPKFLLSELTIQLPIDSVQLEAEPTQAREATP